MPPCSHRSLSLLPLSLPPPKPSPYSLPLRTLSLHYSFLPKLPRTKPLSCSASSPKHIQEHGKEEILQFVTDASDRNIATLPCVRTFENDLARLSLVGSVGFDQAITAAAADGGRASSEHLRSGFSSMVVETVFPGPSDDHATVSTRLFLPAEKVGEKARKLRARLAEDILSGTSSENVLAMTFRQVVMRRLRNFELVLFQPGVVRDMEDLENPREVPVSFLLELSDECVMAALAEAVCVAALQDTEKQFFNDALGRLPGGFLHWFQKRERIASEDFSVIIDKLLEDEVLENARNLMESCHLTEGGFPGTKVRHKYNWWAPVSFSKLEKMGGHEFIAWMSEYVPAYRIQIDANRVKDVKFEGWIKLTENRWEVLLTHSQMVGLAEVLDMYYEDMYSLPNKELSSSVVASVVNIPSKKTNSLMNILSVTLASGIFLVGIGTLGLFLFPHLRKGKIYTHVHRFLPSSEIEYAVNEPLNVVKVIVKKMNDAICGPTRVVMEQSGGARNGQIAKFKSSRCGTEFNSEKNSDNFSSLEKSEAQVKSFVQDTS